MTLLEQLQNTKPRFYKSGVKHEEIFDLVKKHFDEISQARALGYSMSQISNALKKVWGDKVDWKYVHGPCIIEYYYNKIRKENNK